MSHSHDHGHAHSHFHEATTVCSGDHGGHHHPHHHHGQPNGQGMAFSLAIALNMVFVAVELAFGVFAHSTALIADAGHNLSDVLGLILAWAAAMLARRLPTERFTYGLRASSIWAALANAAFLLISCGAIAWAAILRFGHPPAVASTTVMVVAGLGVAVNGVSAWLFVRGSKEDLNIRAAYLHMAADAAISLAVVVAGALMFFTHWYWLDPLMSVLIVAVIIKGTWALLQESVRLAMNAVPQQIDVAAVAGYLRQCSGVADIHDLHIWGMSTTENALTVHLVMPAGYPGDAVMDEIAHTLEARFFVHHSTLQIEQGTTEHACSLGG